MTALTYFTITGTFLAALKDSVYDVDNDPELSPMSGTVTFTPLIDSGDSLPATTLTPASNLFLVPIKATIRSGVITCNGATGVKLVANTAVLGLTGNLYYRVDFGDGLTAGGKTYSVRGYDFQAPTTATTVDLVEVTPVAGQPATGPVPSSAVLSVAGRTGNIVITAADVVGAESTANKGAANGYAGLDGSGKILPAALPAGVLTNKGSTDCSGNPNYPSAVRGDAYVVTVAGKVGGASGKSVDVGDVYFATADNAGGTQASVGASWAILEHNLVGALLSANNLSDIGSAATARANLGVSLADSVNVKEFGALGVGGNDTAAIAAALSAAQTAGRPLYFPAGIYGSTKITDTSDIDWIGDGGIVTHIFALPTTTTLVDVSNGSRFKRMSGIMLDANGVANTCLNSSYPTVTSLRHDFRDLFICGYLTVGWIGDNNNDCDFTNITVSKNGNTPDGAIAARLHSYGGGLAFNNCTFEQPIQISAQSVAIRDGYNLGIVFDDDETAGPWWGKFNTLSVENGYLYPNPATHNNIDVAANVNLQASFIGGWIESGNNDGYVFGGAGNLRNVAAVGGHWLGHPDTSPAPKIAANTLTPSGLAGVINLDGVFVENLNIADATNVKVYTRNVDNAGTRLSTSRNIDGQAFNGTADITVIAPGTHSATGKTTPVDADELALVDSAASNVLKKLTWANLKAAIKSYIESVGIAPRMSALLDTNGAAMLSLGLAGSAVNNLQITNAAAGGSPAISAIGASADVSFVLVPKGAGTITVYEATGQTMVNVVADGSAADIGIDLLPKGAGLALAGGNPISTKVGVPSTATSTGKDGWWAADSSWLYICTSPNVWKRVAIATW